MYYSKSKKEIYVRKLFLFENSPRGFDIILLEENKKSTFLNCKFGTTSAMTFANGLLIEDSIIFYEELDE